MNQEQNNVSVDAITDNRPTAEQSLHNENQEFREYYLRQLRLMCPTMSTDKSDNARLGILKQRTARLIEMLTLFEHSWTEEVPVLQKACLSYLAIDTVPRKERQQIIEAWAGWSDFHFRLARYRGLLAQFLQYQHRMWDELESLLSPADTGTTPESPETNQEGGK